MKNNNNNKLKWWYNPETNLLESIDNTKDETIKWRYNPKTGLSEAIDSELELELESDSVSVPVPKVVETVEVVEETTVTDSSTPISKETTVIVEETEEEVTKETKVTKEVKDIKEIKDGTFLWYNPRTDLFEERKNSEIADEQPTPGILSFKEKTKKLKIHGLVFNELREEIWIEESTEKTDPKITYDSIQEILKDLKKIGSKGFVNQTDMRRLPVISKFIELFTTDNKYLRGNKVEESYKWIYNVVMMCLYELSIKELDRLEQDVENENESDLKADIKNLTRTIFSKLDPSLRNKLQKKGISIMQNIYTGFDTEYKNIDTTRNKLISVQLAVNTKTLLKIPRYRNYELCSLDTLTNKVYKQEITSSKEFNYVKVEKTLNKSINEIRLLKYKNNDKSISILIEGLNNLNIPCMTKDDVFVFSFPRSPIQPFIYYNNEGKGYSFEDMVKQVNTLGEPYLTDAYSELIDLLKNISNKVVVNESNESNDIVTDDMVFKSEGNEIKSKDQLTLNEYNVLKTIEATEPPKEMEILKKMTRSSMNSFTADKVSVTKIRTNYFLAHLTNADLSMLNDFEIIKEKLNIVNKSFVTLGKPIVIGGTNVVIRDTMLLAPAGKRSLASIGSLYGQEQNKISLTQEQIQNMDLLLKKDKELFDSYALKDAVIPLIHGNFMEDYVFRLNELGVPITLSSIGAKYVKYSWEKRKYVGYQLSSKYLLGESSITQTPKGLLATKKTGIKLSYYISNYKGGRNESYMYGVDNDTKWFDYDLTSAYTTVMAGLGNPDYSRGMTITKKVLDSMSFIDILYSYIVIKASFKFNKKVKYPSIPCFLDETTIVYPLQGECILTGSEYLLAKKQECKLTIDEIYLIPFEKDEEDNLVNQPFKSEIKEIQSERRKHPKGTINNLMEKEKGNSIYGQVVRGMSNKKNFDIKSGLNLRMEASVLSNPILASWTTAFVRSVIGECLHKINDLNGKIVSVTTDGFITNIEDLEAKLIDNSNSLMKEFKILRADLSGNDLGLELKNSGKGIISWTTRGQLGKESNIKASTGFQSNNYSLNELDNLFKEVLKSEEKSIEFIQSSLRSALDLYKKGGHVTMNYRDQIFRLHYDNRRLIKELDNIDNIDFSSILLDSDPLEDVKHCGTLRYLGKLHKQSLYNKTSSALTGNRYKDYTDLAIRNFIKGLLSNPVKYNLDNNLDNNLTDYTEIIDFVKGFNPKMKITKPSISNLKNRKMIFKSVPRTKETIKFVEYVKTKYKLFDDISFFTKVK